MGQLLEYSLATELLSQPLVQPYLQIKMVCGCFSQVITGKYPIGVAKYVEKGNTFGTSLDSYPPLVFYANMHSLYSLTGKEIGHRMRSYRCSLL